MINMLRITKHAMERYKERVKNIDNIEIVKDITKIVGPLYEVLGNGLYPIHNKLAVVKNGYVVTIIPTKVQQWRYEL